MNRHGDNGSVNRHGDNGSVGGDGDGGSVDRFRAATVLGDESGHRQPVMAPPRRRPAWLPFVAVSTVIALLVVSLAALTFGLERERFRERAAIAAHNLTRLLDQHISNEFDQVDIVLQSTVLAYTKAVAAGRASDAQLSALLTEQQALLPSLDSLRIADAAGSVRYGRGVPTGERIDVSDREYFQQARDDPRPRMIVVGPVAARISKRWVIVLARRLDGPDGNFAGVLYANLPTTHFDQILGSIALGRDGAVTIRTTDLALVHRVPDTRGAVGSRNVSPEFAEQVRRQPDDGTFTATTALDGIERTNAYRKVPGYPFYVLVGLATDSYLGGWQQNVAIVFGLAGVALAVTLGAAILGYRANRQLAADLDARQRMVAELERAMAERARLNEELEARAHDAEAANRAKSTFLANMSHELRTPLNGILGMIDLAQRRAHDPKQRDFLRKAQTASKRLLAIIADILDLARIDAGRMLAIEEDFRLGDVLDNVVALVEPEAQTKGLALMMAIPAELRSLELHGDPLRLEQILLNLVGNAIKFTTEGKIEVRVEARVETRVEAQVETRVEGQVELRFEIRDTGIGIAPEDQGRLFARFVQVDASATRRYGGTGLGLVICKSLVELMGGTIGVESRPGVGSTFWFTVRLRRPTGLVGRAADGPPVDDHHGAVARPVQARIDDAEAALRQRHAGARILVVEDEDLNREVAMAGLQAAGLDVEAVADGAAAVAAAGRQPFAAILMDIKMPIMDGLEATRRIRELPGYARVPILALTAHAFPEDEARSLAAGMNAHIAKPIDAGRMYAVLLEWLDGTAR